eukprot:GHVU01117344.1.p1 GENE.GHVU01117344.1~~GHVU01117344.1.p1  ORF type:complete len:147 (-),score=8.26 GHVU01117344.1:30-470(-)
MFNCGWWSCHLCRAQLHNQPLTETGCHVRHQQVYGCEDDTASKCLRMPVNLAMGPRRIQKSTRYIIVTKGGIQQMIDANRVTLEDLIGAINIKDEPAVTPLLADVGESERSKDVEVSKKKSNQKGEAVDEHWNGGEAWPVEHGQGR